MWKEVESARNADSVKSGCALHPAHFPCVKTIAENKVMLDTPLVLADWNPFEEQAAGAQRGKGARRRQIDKRSSHPS